VAKLETIGGQAGIVVAREPVRAWRHQEERQKQAPAPLELPAQEQDLLLKGAKLARWVQVDGVQDARQVPLVVGKAARPNC
jgi:hypothetical protein